MLTHCWLFALQKTSSICVLSLTMFIVSFVVEKFLILMKSSLSIIFCNGELCVLFRYPSLPNPKSQRYSTLLSSKNYEVLLFTLKSLIYKEFCLISMIIDYPIKIIICPSIIYKIVLLFPANVMQPLSYIRFPNMSGFICWTLVCLHPWGYFSVPVLMPHCLSRTL